MGSCTSKSLVASHHDGPSSQAFDVGQKAPEGSSLTRLDTPREHTAEEEEQKRRQEKSEREIVLDLMKKSPSCFDHISIRCEEGEDIVNAATVMFMWYRNHGYTDTRPLPATLPDMAWEGLFQLRHIRCLELCNYPNTRLSKSIRNLTSLEQLTISGSETLEEFPAAIGELVNLKELRICGCSSLKSLPAEIGKVENLERLELYGCSSLSALPPELCHLQRLERLEICLMENLESLPDNFGSLEALASLTIKGCPLLSNLPSSIGQLSSLKELLVAAGGMSGPTDMTIPAEIRQCPRLEKITFHRMRQQFVSSFFAEPWPETATTSTLEKVCLPGCGLDDEQCRAIIPNLPASLQTLDLSTNKISTLKWFVQHGLPSQIRYLTLTHNPILESEDPEERSNLTKLLNVHRNLGWMDWRFGIGMIFTPSHLELLLLNRCGRGLMGGSKALPLSLWPAVLENVERSVKDSRRGTKDYRNKAAKMIQASVMFFLLQGPAFLDRGGI